MDNKFDLEVSKNFDCPVIDLYKAWTSPEQLQQWWRPLGKWLVSVENDLRQGGTVKYLFDEEDFFIDGTYQQINPETLLEYTWQWHLPASTLKDSAFKLSVHFEDSGTGSKITIKQAGFETQESIHPHSDGWENALDQLAQYLQGNQALQTPIEPGSQSKPPISGYNETPEQVKVGGG